MKKLRTFETEKIEEKIYALTLWRDGVPIVSLARELGRSRETIYRWIKESQVLLEKNKSRKRSSIDDSTKFKIIETFILLKRPSVRKLSIALEAIFFIRISPSQLRRSLARWGFQNYKPSAFFDLMVSNRARILDAPKISFDELPSQKISAKSFERFLPRDQ